MRCKRIIYSFFLWIIILNFDSSEDELKTNSAEEFLLDLKKKETLEQSKSLYFVQNEDDYNVKNITWPNIGEFNEAIAAQKIEEFIRSVNFEI